MGQLNNEDWEHVDISALREAIVSNGVISDLEVTESTTPAMTVQVASGQCTIDGVVYTEASSQNLNVSNGDATHDRKDIVVYDATAGNPAVVAGTPAAAPIPPDIPSGDILLGIVLVGANESTSIVNADITNDRVYSNQRWANTSVSANTTLNDAHYVVSIDASGGARTITLPTAVGIRGKVYVIKKTDSSTNAVTIDPNGAQTIDGSSTTSLVLQYQSVFIQSDGSNWIKIGTDKSNNEIRDAVEAATDSNTFNDADHSKLNGIASGADVTGSNQPQSHKNSHEYGGSDEVSPNGFTTPNNVTASRSFGTIYRNTTGTPISAHIIGTSSTSGTVTFTFDISTSSSMSGSIRIVDSYLPSAIGAKHTITPMIPNNYYYRAQGSPCSVGLWMEISG